MMRQQPFTRVRVVEAFRYSPEGRANELKVPDEVFDLRTELLNGLLGEGVVDPSDEPVTPPDELARLREQHAARTATEALEASKAAAAERRAAAAAKRAPAKRAAATTSP